MRSWLIVFLGVSVVSGIAYMSRDAEGWGEPAMFFVALGVWVAVALLIARFARSETTAKAAVFGVLAPPMAVVGRWCPEPGFMVDVTGATLLLSPVSGLAAGLMAAAWRRFVFRLPSSASGHWASFVLAVASLGPPLFVYAIVLSETEGPWVLGALFFGALLLGPSIVAVAACWRPSPVLLSLMWSASLFSVLVSLVTILSIGAGQLASALVLVYASFLLTAQWGKELTNQVPPDYHAARAPTPFA